VLPSPSPPPARLPRTSPRLLLHMQSSDAASIICEALGMGGRGGGSGGASSSHAVASTSHTISKGSGQHQAGGSLIMTARTTLHALLLPPRMYEHSP